ncbi:hypothetical protein AAFN88_14210 [Pelagibius sp. CAU 1746]|uniref:hypothetical protein n=1 Tax=Pelagibius sp. CAU 1746 TaxID=3140370 RepID=UPI00325AFE4A
MRRLLAAGLLMLLSMSPVQAGEADVVAAEAVQESDGTWRFRVTVRHGDEGWEHYADRWQVETRDGRVLGTRVLLHPHEQEQPFTRALGGVTVPPEVDEVVIRAHDSVHGDGGAVVTVRLR